MTKTKLKITQFSLIGQLIGFIFKDGVKLKYLRMAVDERECWIKLPKQIRTKLEQEIFNSGVVATITPGCWLKIHGYQKRSPKTGKIKFKAETVELLDGSDHSPGLRGYEAIKPAKVTSAKILVCNKSSCRKRGAKQVCQALLSNLEKLGLEEKIEVKSVGCLKQCKKAPNLVIMPDKARYSYVKTQQIPELLTLHFKNKESD